MNTQQLRGTKLPSPRFRIAPLSDDLQKVKGFHSLQTFFPTLNKLYRINKHQSEAVWFDSKWRICGLDISGTSGPCRLRLIPNTDVSGVPDVTVGVAECNAYLKVTHLLDPIRWMKGQYSLPKHPGLPWHNKTWITASNKLQDPCNQAYVETMASYALGRLREEGLSPHFNHFYGAFCARADLYRYNLTDDFGSMRCYKWFWSGQKKGMYSLRVINSEDPEGALDDDLVDELLREPTSDESDIESIEEEEVEIGEEEAAAVAAAGDIEIQSLHSDDLSDVEYAEEDSEGNGSDESDESDSDYTESSNPYESYRIYSEFRDFPVMMIAIDDNRGTMDNLLDDYKEVGAEPGTADWDLRWSAWLFQVLAAMSCAQSLLGFTHNDLHTNNIVWSETTEEFLYYQNRAGDTFKVPTFGKLFRIIDFGRSIFTINGRQFISDDFRAGNDAEGQYAFKPLLSKVKEGDEVHPNPSFDLCRLAVSLFDTLYPKHPANKEGGAVLSSEEGMKVMETVSPLYNVIWSWMIDDEGRNVLVKPNGEERFPDFDLYRHIAAKIHNAVPALQFSKPAFDQFQVSSSEVDKSVKRWHLFC